MLKIAEIFFDYLILKWRVLISSILTYVFVARDI